MQQDLMQGLSQAISQARNKPFRADGWQTRSGGCIHSALRISQGGEHLFVKCNSADTLPMFQAEARALTALARTETLRVPQVICCGHTAGHAFLVLEYLDLEATGSAAEAGRQLARLHHHLGTDHGWCEDNWIGTSIQHNEPQRQWSRFWREQRLAPQLQMAANRGYGGRLQKLGDQLLSRIDMLLDHDPPPSLLHGDLWGGNLGYLQDGSPVAFDPASYWGDRETDLAMSELFGRQPESFYRAYQELWPLPEGYPLRRTLYNLYHILNHLNLFGGSYLAPAERMMETVLANCR